MADLEHLPTVASSLCVEAQRRLMTRVEGLGDATMRSPSRLEEWTVGHVLTHLARNADAHARRVAGALRGEDVSKYAGGAEQRRREIAEGACRSATDIIEDLRHSQQRLEDLFAAADAADWPHADFRGGGDYGVGGCPAHRLREVEMHHVDLGLGYTHLDWPAAYVEWDLVTLLTTVPERLDSLQARRALMAWLAGRGSLNPDLPLQPWG